MQGRNIKGPLDFLTDHIRKPLFIALVTWTLGLFGVMQLLNQPLVTSIAPAGIVSLELAGTSERALGILRSWAAAPGPVQDYAVFGLGLDYLFMPSYAITIALGVMLAASRNKGP